MKTVLLVLAVALTGTYADVSHLSGIQTILHDDGYHYDKPQVPFPPPPSVDKKEEYLPPPAQPLCENGAPDSTAPYCCSNGARNEYCCQGRYVNPTCSPPPPPVQTTPRYIAPTTPRYVPPPPPPPPRPLCDNGAPDSTAPYCCSNGARNEYCCQGPYVNPTCSAPPPPQPLCDNGAPDSSYPYCCSNGAKNEYCCTGRFVNPTCSEPTTTTPRYVPPPPPPPPKPLCDNRAPDSSYPYCCSNGARNEFCCQGPYVNPTCSAPPPPPAPTTPRYIAPTTRYNPPPPPPPKVNVNDNYLPPCGNGGTGPNCDTSDGYNYDRPAIAFRY